MHSRTIPSLPWNSRQYWICSIPAFLLPRRRVSHGRRRRRAFAVSGLAAASAPGTARRRTWSCTSPTPATSYWSWRRRRWRSTCRWSPRPRRSAWWRSRACGCRDWPACTVLCKKDPAMFWELCTPGFGWYFLALFRLYGLWKTFSLKLYAISEIWSFWLCGQF